MKKIFTIFLFILILFDLKGQGFPSNGTPFSDSAYVEVQDWFFGGQVGRSKVYVTNLLSMSLIHKQDILDGNFSDGEQLVTYDGAVYEVTTTNVTGFSPDTMVVIPTKGGFATIQPRWDGKYHLEDFGLTNNGNMDDDGDNIIKAGTFASLVDRAHFLAPKNAYYHVDTIYSDVNTSYTLLNVPDSTIWDWNGSTLYVPGYYSVTNNIYTLFDLKTSDEIVIKNIKFDSDPIHTSAFWRDDPMVGRDIGAATSNIRPINMTANAALLGDKTLGSNNCYFENIYVKDMYYGIKFAGHNTRASKICTENTVLAIQGFSLVNSYFSDIDLFMDTLSNNNQSQWAIYLIDNENTTWKNVSIEGDWGSTIQMTTNNLASDRVNAYLNNFSLKETGVVVTKAGRWNMNNWMFYSPKDENNLGIDNGRVLDISGSDDGLIEMNNITINNSNPYANARIDFFGGNVTIDHLTTIGAAQLLTIGTGNDNVFINNYTAIEPFSVQESATSLFGFFNNPNIPSQSNMSLNNITVKLGERHPSVNNPSIIKTEDRKVIINGLNIIEPEGINGGLRNIVQVFSDTLFTMTNSDFTDVGYLFLVERSSADATYDPFVNLRNIILSDGEAIVSNNAECISMNGIKWCNGDGTPETNITAPVGSMYSDKLNGDFYFKQSGTGNTGWILK